MQAGSLGSVPAGVPVTTREGMLMQRLLATDAVNLLEIGPPPTSTSPVRPISRAPAVCCPRCISLFSSAPSRQNVIDTMPNTVAYFDITIGGAAAGRIEFELFDDVVPKAS